MVRITVIAVFTLCSAVERLRRGQPVELCSISRTDDLNADPVSVFLLPGNSRTFSFGEHAKTTESTVKCKGDTSCSAPDGPVKTIDVAECPACPCDVSDEARLSASIGVMFDGIQPVCSLAEKDKNVDMLLIGLGGGTLHRHVRKECPEGTRVRSVEIDARVAGVAEKYFGLELASGVSEIDVTDALSAVRKLSSSRTSPSQTSVAFLSNDGDQNMGSEGWDVVAIDCFIGHGETPADCRSSEFVSDVHNILKPNGVVFHHIWHTSPENSAVAPEFRETLALYQSMFGNDTVTVESIPRDPSVMWDDVIVARNGGQHSATAGSGDHLAQELSEAEKW
jgi:spermidine synthase